MWKPLIRTKSKTWKTLEQKDEYKGENYFDRLSSELGVTHHTVNFDAIGFKNSASEVIKSDYFRYWALSEFGGVWSDCDIVYVKPLHTVFTDTTPIDTVIGCNTTRAIYFPVGFLMATKGNPLFKRLLSFCPSRYNPNEYQCLGSLLFKSIFPTIDSVKQKFPKLNTVIMDKWWYLPLEWDCLDEIFKKEATTDVIKANTFGIHWFNGSAEAKAFQNEMTDSDKMTKSGTLYKHIKEYL